MMAILKEFSSILQLFKDYQTAFWVSGMARGVPLLSKNAKSKSSYNTSQNIEPKIDENCEKWNLEFIQIFCHFKAI